MNIESLQNKIETTVTNFNTLADKITEIETKLKTLTDEANALVAAKTNLQNEQRVLQGEYRQLALLINEIEEEKKNDITDSEAEAEMPNTPNGR